MIKSKKMKIIVSLLTIIILLTNSNFQKLDISQIKFKAAACYGECPIFEMTIASDGTAKYNAIKFNKLEGQFQSIIKKPQLDSLIKLIEKSNFLSLNKKYSTDWTDLPTYTLTISLKDGQSKTIEDYGLGGPEKLQNVFRQIFSLRESQDWLEIE